MESTGKCIFLYTMHLHNELKVFISNVVVANPKWVKCIKGEKNDSKDAKCIADLLKLGIVCFSFIPTKNFVSYVSLQNIATVLLAIKFLRKIDLLML